jgi:hypothetical protein
MRRFNQARISLAEESAGEDHPSSHRRGLLQGGSLRRGAARGGSMRQLGGVGMLQSHAADFGLSDAQLDRLDALQEGHELEKVDLRAALRKARIRLRTRMRAPQTPEHEVLAAIDEVGSCEGELRKMRYRHLQAARAVLSEEQRHQVDGFHRRQLQLKARALQQTRHAG